MEKLGKSDPIALDKDLLIQKNNANVVLNIEQGRVYLEIIDPKVKLLK